MADNLGFNASVCPIVKTFQALRQFIDGCGILLALQNCPLKTVLRVPPKRPNGSTCRYRQSMR